MKRLFTLILMLCLVGAIHAQPTTPKYGENIPSGAVLGYYPATGKFYVLPVNASGSLVVDAGAIGGDYLEVDEFDTLVAKDDRSFQAVSFLIGGADALTASGTDWIALGGLGFGRTDLFGSLYLNEAIFAQALETNIRIGATESMTGITGDYNYTMGAEAGASITGGTYNLAFGFKALSKMTSGFSNVALGLSSMERVTGGSINIAIGSFAGARTAAGGYNTNLSNCIYLGYDTRSLQNDTKNEIVIGTGAIGHGNNTVTIGSSSVTLNYLSGTMNLSAVPEYADNAAASAGGLASGTFYHTAGVLKIVY